MLGTVKIDTLKLSELKRWAKRRGKETQDKRWYLLECGASQ